VVDIHHGLIPARFGVLKLVELRIPYGPHGRGGCLTLPSSCRAATFSQKQPQVDSSLQREPSRALLRNGRGGSRQSARSQKSTACIVTARHSNGCQRNSTSGTKPQEKVHSQTNTSLSQQQKKPTTPTLPTKHTYPGNESTIHLKTVSPTQRSNPNRHRKEPNQLKTILFSLFTSTFPYYLSN
jgi:hypothetical protein